MSVSSKGNINHKTDSLLLVPAERHRKKILGSQKEPAKGYKK